MTSVDADGVWVETLKKSSCDACSARSGCGQRLLADSALKNMSAIKAFFPPGESRAVSVGDQIEIGITENALVVAALLVYLLPLALMVAGAYLGAQVGPSSIQGGRSDIASALCAVVGLAVGAFVIRWHSVKHRDTSKYHAVILGSPEKDQHITLHCP